MDILKPHQPGVDLVARTLMKINGVTSVRIKVEELDSKTASCIIKIAGTNLSLENVTDELASLNCALHSVDEVICEEKD